MEARQDIKIAVISLSPDGAKEFAEMMFHHVEAYESDITDTYFEVSSQLFSKGTSYTKKQCNDHNAKIRKIPNFDRSKLLSNGIDPTFYQTFERYSELLEYGNDSINVNVMLTFQIFYKYNLEILDLIRHNILIVVLDINETNVYSNELAILFSKVANHCVHVLPISLGCMAVDTKQKFYRVTDEKNYKIQYETLSQLAQHYGIFDKVTKLIAMNKDIARLSICKTIAEFGKDEFVNILSKINITQVKKISNIDSFYTKNKNLFLDLSGFPYYRMTLQTIIQDNWISFLNNNLETDIRDMMDTSIFLNHQNHFTDQMTLIVFKMKSLKKITKSNERIQEYLSKSIIQMTSCIQNSDKDDDAKKFMTLLGEIFRETDLELVKKTIIDTSNSINEKILSNVLSSINLDNKDPEHLMDTLIMIQKKLNDDDLLDDTKKKIMKIYMNKEDVQLVRYFFNKEYDIAMNKLMKMIMTHEKGEFYVNAILHILTNKLNMACLIATGKMNIPKDSNEQAYINMEDITEYFKTLRIYMNEFYITEYEFLIISVIQISQRMWNLLETVDAQISNVEKRIEKMNFNETKNYINLDVYILNFIKKIDSNRISDEDEPDRKRIYNLDLNDDDYIDYNEISDPEFDTEYV